MPKEKTRRTELHHPSIKLPKRQFALEKNAVEHVNIGEASDVSGNDILHYLSVPQSSVPSMSKREKQHIKREAFLQRLTSGLSPYSKSHVRRMKRKAKEQIAGGFSDIKAAVTELAEDAPNSDPTVEIETLVDTTRPARNKVNSKAGKIGEGKRVPLIAMQRKRVLQLEQIRQPAILFNPTFVSSPFLTIRTHAENTLIKHQIHNQ